MSLTSKVNENTTRLIKLITNREDHEIKSDLMFIKGYLHHAKKQEYIIDDEKVQGIYIPIAIKTPSDIINDNNKSVQSGEGETLGIFIEDNKVSYIKEEFHIITTIENEEMSYTTKNKAFHFISLDTLHSINKEEYCVI